MNSKSQSKTTPQSAPEQEALPMQMEVKIHALNTSGNVLANASVTLNGCFAVRGVKVISSENGPFVSMPHYKSRDGYKDICFPCTSSSQTPYPSLPGKARKLAHFVAPPLRGRPATLGSATMFSDAVVAAYRQELAQLPQRQQVAPQEHEAPPAPAMTM